MFLVPNKSNASLMESACENASEWNVLLKWARKERGPFLDPNTLTYQFCPHDPARSSSSRLALKYQPQIPEEFKKFKKDHPENQANFDLSASQNGDFYDTSGYTETKLPIQPNYTGRLTRFQLQQQANNAQAQLDTFGASPHTNSKFSHATAASFKSQVSLQTSIANNLTSGSPNGSSSVVNNNPITRSPVTPSSYPRKGRSKRVLND